MFKSDSYVTQLKRKEKFIHPKCDIRYNRLFERSPFVLIVVHKFFRETKLRGVSLGKSFNFPPEGMNSNFITALYALVSIWLKKLKFSALTPIHCKLLTFMATHFASHCNWKILSFFSKQMWLRVNEFHTICQR